MNKNIEELTSAILKLRNKDEVIDFLIDLMTVPEIKMFAARLQVAQMLLKGHSYIEIEKTTGISSATIARISKCLNYGTGGYIKVLDRIKKSK